MPAPIEKNIHTDNGGDEFQVRLLKDEGVGLVTTRTGDSYLILDSLDYWYDVRQNQTPQKQKCSCKSDWFNILFRYYYRDDSSEIREVQIITTCTSCRKTAMKMSVDIKYAPTEQLVLQPIVFCEKPNLRYKLNDFSALWTSHDLERFLRFMYDELNMKANMYFIKLAENIRGYNSLSYKQAIEMSSRQLFFSQKLITCETPVKSSDGSFMPFDLEPWRKGEVINLLSYISANLGPMYHIMYCTEYIDKGEVMKKTNDFSELTDCLTKWLKENFIRGRGKNCFDSEEMYQKYKSLRANQ